MTLRSDDLKALSAAQEEPIPAEEFRHIQKKSGERAIRILFTVLSVLLVIASAGSFLADREFPLFYILVLAFLTLPMCMDSYRNRKKNPCACYGTVVQKTVRCARISGKASVYLPYHKTSEPGTFKHKFTLSATTVDYFFCHVEINGQVYENVCCQSKDFQDISVGDRVIVANDEIYLCPVIYRLSVKTESRE